MDLTTENVVGLLTETLPNRLGLDKLKGVESWKRYQLADVNGAVLKKILAEKGLTSNKSEMNYVHYVDGGTLLHLVSFLGCEDTVEWMLANTSYFYPHSTNKAGNTPLHAAVANCQTSTIKILRYYHADVYAENNDGKTALAIAQEAGDDEAKEVLLANRFVTEELETEYLQERLPQLVERVLNESCEELECQHCLMCLRGEIRVATSSLTSVPKPLKILREHYTELKNAHTKMSPVRNKQLLADILSVLAMTIDEEKSCLLFRLEGSQEAIASFGHPYIRRLCAQIPDEWGKEGEREERLTTLVFDIIHYCLEHNAESEACDLLMEVDEIEKIEQFVTEEAHDRVCLYLISCVKYVPEPDDAILLRTALNIYRKFQGYPQALRLAMMLNDQRLVGDILLECPNKMVQKQLAFMLGRQQIFLELEEKDCPEADDLTEIMANVHLNNNFLNLARELDIMDPKVPEDIYKTHLEHARFSTAQPVDSARANLSSSLVNGFVNCAFGVDKLLTEDGNKWIYKNKANGMLSATASLGLILLWDVEGGLTQIDKFLYSNEDYIKAGALLACGIVNSGVRNECDPALALLTDYLLHNSNIMRIGAVIGLGLAYAGSGREDIIEILTPVLWNQNSSYEVVCLSALSCAMVAVGSCNGELGECFIHIMLERERSELLSTHTRFLALALGLLYLGKQEDVEATTEAVKAIGEPISTFVTVLLDICAYAGTGNVLKIQSLLHICSEYFGSDVEEEEGAASSGGGKKAGSKEGDKPSSTSSDGSTATETATKSKSKSSEDKEKKSSSTADNKPDSGSLSEPGAHQMLAVLGIALITMGEDIGSEMSLRTFNHLLRYGEPVIRRAVPLALALLSTSNPQLNILDTLSKFSHDSDTNVARNAIFAMGLVGSGTNNARLAGLLRNLAQFYHKDPLDLFMVRLAQGLTHLGKGTLTLNAFHSDRGLMTPVAVAGLLVVMMSMLDSANIILGNSHYMIYFLTPAIQPRMLVTFDETLSPISVSVRVGQAVDVVGQAGKPKSITGFQTHTTPVLLAFGERAELATTEYLPLSPFVEGFVVLRKNPDYDEN